jgi:hypothetical protein
VILILHLIYPKILVCTYTTHILHTYSNISITKIEASFCIISYDVFALYGSTSVIFNDCCIRVLELPDNGLCVTEICSILKIYFCCVDGLSNHVIHLWHTTGCTLWRYSAVFFSSSAIQHRGFRKFVQVTQSLISRRWEAIRSPDGEQISRLLRNAKAHYRKSKRLILSQINPINNTLGYILILSARLRLDVLNYIFYLGLLTIFWCLVTHECYTLRLSYPPWVVFNEKYWLFSFIHLLLLCPVCIPIFSHYQSPAIYIRVHCYTIVNTTNS